MEANDGSAEELYLVPSRCRQRLPNGLPDTSTRRRGRGSGIGAGLPREWRGR